MTLKYVPFSLILSGNSFRVCEIFEKTPKDNTWNVWQAMMMTVLKSNAYQWR